MNRKFSGLIISIALGTIILTHPFLRKIVFADTGIYAASRLEVGNTLQTRSITLSTSANTTIASALNNRPDETCFNNSANTIWIGSNTASTDLLRIGIPILSSSTFKLGAMSGAVSALCNTGTCEVRCADGLTL